MNGKRFGILLLFAALYAAIADVAAIKAEILKKLIHLFKVQDHPTLYLDPNCSGAEIPTDELGKIVAKPSKAKVIITCDIDRSRPARGYRDDQVIITLSYRDYIRHTDRAAGAFFWQKGRPNIIINARYLKRHGIQIPKKYEPFVE